MISVCGDGGGRGVARSGSVRAICDNNMYAANLVPRVFWVFFKMAGHSTEAPLFCGATRHFEKYPEGPGDEVVYTASCLR